MSLLPLMWNGGNMPNSKSIGVCEFCGWHYCMECSDAVQYELYCSKRCEEFSKNDLSKNIDIR